MTEYDDDDIDILRAPGEWLVGDRVTCLHGGLTLGWGEPLMGSANVLSRGQVLVVDAATLEHRADTLALVDDHDRQRARWGEVRLIRGEHEIEPWTEIGSGDWHRARKAELDRASFIANPSERAEAIREISAKYGRVPTSTSVVYNRTRMLAEDAARRAGQHYSVKSLAE